MAMDAEIKAQWVAALRSGEYQQGTSALNYQGQQCCLGVLCELAVKAGVAQRNQYSPESFVDYGPAGSEHTGGPAWDDVLLPGIVQEWAGLNSAGPAVLMDGETRALTGLNDSVTYADPEDYVGTHDYSFATIADLIEADADI